MADTTIVRGKTLPDSGVKNDLHELIDLSTVTVANIVDADVSNTAAIAGTKINPNFGAQAVTISSLTAFPTTPEEAPDADYEIANKKYVDDQVKALGTPYSRSATTIYQATDGDTFVTTIGDGTPGSVGIYAHTASDPSSSKYLISAFGESNGNYSPGACLLIPKDYYYTITATSLSVAHAVTFV